MHNSLPKENQKWLVEHDWQKFPNQQVHNPIKEGIKSGYRTVRFFWALIVLVIIILLLVRYGSRLGIELRW